MTLADTYALAMTPPHGFSAAEVDDLLIAVGEFARSRSLLPPAVEALPLAMLRVASGTDPSAYAVQLVRDDPRSITLDRVEIRRDLRRQHFGSCLYYAVEDWARRAGIVKIDAHAQGLGAPLAALVGFNFDDRDSYSEHLDARHVQVPPFRYPFEVVAMRPPPSWMVVRS